MDKKLVMGMYNKARAAAKQGKLDPIRTNKALGILQSKDAGRAKFAEYRTTTKACSCPDYHRTGKPCKHMIAKMIEVRATQIQPAPVAQPIQRKVDHVLFEGEIHYSNGGVRMCEQRNTQHIDHLFDSKSDFIDFAKAHLFIKFVNPTLAKGRKVSTVEDHRERF